MECAGFYFFSNFDSGNLQSVELASSTTCPNEVPNIELNLITKADCVGTVYETDHRAWFQFAMMAPRPDELVKFNIVGLKMLHEFNNPCPVYKIIPGRKKWKRISDKPEFNFDEDHGSTLSFKLRMPSTTQRMLLVAFTYPYPYSKLQEELQLAVHSLKNVTLSSSDDIYFMHECMCYSLKGRKAYLITITSFHNITAEREVRLKNLFPDEKMERPYIFQEKKVIFITARVHPAETPSSFVMHGLMNLLLKRNDPVAIALRRNYVFKLIPCLNPDGVVSGHYCTDTRGVDLNSVYLDPDFKEHPTIYAVRALINYYHYDYDHVDDTNASKINECKVTHDKNTKMFFVEEEKGYRRHTETYKYCDEISITPNKKIMQRNICDHKSGLFLYIDLQAHSSKPGMFMYGNQFEDMGASIECMLLPKIMSLNNHHFNFDVSNFIKANLYHNKTNKVNNKAASRVVVYKMTGLVQSYTLECNYNTGYTVNVVSTKQKESERKIRCGPPKYTPRIWQEVGLALGKSILDLTNENPMGHLANSVYHNLNGLRMWLRCHYYDFGDAVSKASNSAKNRMFAPGN